MGDGAMSDPPHGHTTSYHTSHHYYITDTMPYNVHLDNFFEALSLFSFSFGVLGNALALVYFLRRKRDVLTVIYINVALVDLFIAIFTLPIATSLMDDRNASVFFSNQKFCDAWGIIWVVLSRMSVFLAGVLSVYRAYCLTFPFRVVHKTAIIGIILVGYIIHIVGASIPLWWNGQHFHHSSVASCIAFGGAYMPEAAIKAIKVFDYLGILIPIPVIIVSLIVTVVKLNMMKTTTAGGIAERGESDQHRVTVTVSVFTGTYLFFNVPAAVVILIFNFYPFLLWPRFVYLIFYAYVMVISLNAACNPAIYLWRMKQMRQELERLLCRLCGRQTQGTLSATAQSHVSGYAKLTEDCEADNATF